MGGGTTVPRGPEATPDPVGERLREAEAAENFPVAMRVLPARHRRRLRAVYDVVRVIDDIGDESRGDEGAGSPDSRVAALEDLRSDLHRPFPTTAVLRRLALTAPDLPLEPLDRLIDANVQDQRVAEYDTWQSLLHYCTLSADPIGRLVLAIFEVPEDPALLVDSDRVCTALQLLEHLQDVSEDRGRGRIYLPAEDRAAFGVSPTDLDAAVASPALRDLVRHETARAVELLDAGSAITGRLRGWARLAVGGYVSGGRAAADALRRVDGEVLGRAEEAAHSRKRDVLRHLPAVLLSRRTTPRSPTR
ncbi:squalene synthase HpnC [Pseudonocardia ailaonensis]|uniref:Squalene synthase HpnC n=1 Tax=Pseudonocardia ailaonensis TaxID=367279 RepID=A0ABN2MN76_9PSEU